MARIRTIKPEFWDSPSTAKASAVARLAFIAMWNWADDFGRGTANLKELEGFIFPNDDITELSGGKSRNFRDVVAEVSECFGVEFYTVGGRPFYAIPSWQKHQRNERSAKPKYPGPDDADYAPTCDDAPDGGNVRNFRQEAAELPTISGLGTEEQWNSGTELLTSAKTPPREDVDHLCNLLADLIEANGSKRPKIGKTWHDSARLMLDRDERPHDEAADLIRWCQRDEFWRSNILSMPTFREKYDQLRLKAQGGPGLRAVNGDRPKIVRDQWLLR